MHSTMNMTSASNSQQKAHQLCDTSRRIHQDSLHENLTSYNHLHGSLKEKVATSKNLVLNLDNRAKSVEKSIAATKHSLAQLETARRAKEPPLNLCTWRMEQREKRPLREQVRDGVELGLEDERKTLLTCQRSLVDAEKKTKDTIRNLEDALKELNIDISEKKQALSVDDMCLRTTHRNWQTTIDSYSPRGGGTFANSYPMMTTELRKNPEESSRNEVNRQNDASRHVQTAAKKEEAAAQLRADNDKLIQYCQRVSDDALRSAEQRLRGRVDENQRMRNSLEQELRQTQDKIEHTKGTIVDTKSQIKSLEDPLALVSTRDSWRKQRALKEQIHDPVSTMLEDHKLALIRTNEALRNQRQEEKSALRDLQNNKQRLTDDLRDKTLALHIDLNCLSHESMNWHGKPVQKVSKLKLDKALKVDPSFVPVVGNIFGGSKSAR